MEFATYLYIFKTHNYFAYLHHIAHFIFLISSYFYPKNWYLLYFIFLNSMTHAFLSLKISLKSKFQDWETHFILEVSCYFLSFEMISIFAIDFYENFRINLVLLFYYLHTTPLFSMKVAQKHLLSLKNSLIYLLVFESQLYFWIFCYYNYLTLS
jgi:hypothetical protein